MKIIESIRIRTGSGNYQKSIEILQQIATAAINTTPAGTVQLFKENSIVGDFAFFLYWDEKTIGTEGSPLGQKIRKSLEMLGIIDYAMWTLI
jgi:hypothetical protein